MAAGSNIGALAQDDNSTFTVTIVKFINGVHATADNANNASFAMHSVFPGGEGEFSLAASNTPNAYETVISAMPEGSEYKISETLNDTVAASCDGVHPFALLGYGVGDTLQDAANATTTAAVDLTNLSDDMFVAVKNQACTVTPTDGSLTVTKKTTGGDGTFNFTYNGGSFMITTSDGDGSKTISDFTPGSYSVTEGSLGGGWSMTNNTCTNVNVVAGQTATCEIDDQYIAPQGTGSLTVKKITTGSDGTFKFASDDSGVGNFAITTVSGTGSQTFNNLVPGSYDVDEITPLPLGNGWTETKTTCDGVTVTAGQTAACEIDNMFTPPAGNMVTVTIAKYLDGVAATALSAKNASFDMNSTWNAANIGAGSGTFTLGPTGFNNMNPYQATTPLMSSGASYSTSEDMPANCDGANPFMLAGYSVGDTLADAANATTTMAAPDLADITGNQYIIVWNKTCGVTGTTGSLTVTKKTTGGDGTFNFTGSEGIDPFSITTQSGTKSITIGNLTPGSYTITEGSLGLGWSMTNNTCSDVSVTANVASTCEIDNAFTSGGGGGGQTTAKVHIYKFLDGKLATMAAANNYQFPMTATWNSTNLGAGGGDYLLGNHQGNAPDLYGADTSAMSVPADYMTSEVTNDVDSSSKVLPPSADCARGMFQLVGYTMGDTLLDAQNATSTVAAPAFTGLTADKYVIVWNKTCGREVRSAVISGMKYNDKNLNGKRETGEPGLAGWTIYLDANNNGTMDSGEASTTTNMFGAYRFTGLADGTYYVREVPQAGWTQSAPVSGVYDVTLAPGNRFALGKNFGNYSTATNAMWNWRFINGKWNFGRMMNNRFIPGASWNTRGSKK